MRCRLSILLQVYYERPGSYCHWSNDKEFRGLKKLSRSSCSGRTEPSIALGGGVDLTSQLEAQWGDSLPTCSYLLTIYQFGGCTHPSLSSGWPLCDTQAKSQNLNLVTVKMFLLPAKVASSQGPGIPMWRSETFAHHPGEPAALTLQ